MSKFLTLSILSISMITVMASAAVSPALANLAAAFPDVSNNVIKTILTLPSLFIIPFSLLSGRLGRSYGNKRVLCFGIIIYLIGGVAPAFTNSLPMLLFYRAILGCGCGLIMPISQALIALNYSGKMRVRMTGYSGAASYLMGVIASFIVAPLSSINWHFSFYIYLVALLVLILNLIALPNDKPRNKTEVSQQMFPKKVWLLILGMFFVNVAFYAVPANVALFMREEGIGDSSSSGTVISAFMICGFIAGIILPYFHHFFKSYTITSGIFFMAGGYIFLSLSHTLFLVILGSSLVGFSFGILFPAILNTINDSSTTQSILLSLSFASSAQFLGQFMSPYILQLIKNILNFSSLRYDFIILAYSLSIIFFLFFLIKKRPIYKS